MVYLTTKNVYMYSTGHIALGYSTGDIALGI